MNWVGVQDIQKELNLPEGYRLEALKREDVGIFIACLKRWFPDITVGAESRFLKADFYEKNIFGSSRGDWKESHFCPLVAWVGHQIVGWVFLEKNDDALSLSSPMAGTVPHFRNQSIALAFSRILEVTGRLVGAEVVYFIATLKNPGMQRIAEHNGFQLVGILPAFDRDMVAPGCVRRVYEAMYAKVLVGTEVVQKPLLSSLTERTRAMMEFVFGKEQEGHGVERRDVA